LILPSDATYEQFETYVTDLKGPKSRLELAELWEWRQKLLGIRVVTGRGYRERECPADEHHLTLREREKKVIAEARAAGIEPERASV
tara:strand:- start:3701 stop:3961 length:261 start_codon:yes stop_codon:yes gene_type:complete